MKKLLVMAVAAAFLFPIGAESAATTSAAAAMAMAAAGAQANAREGALRNASSGAGCTACHEEVFPLKYLLEKGYFDEGCAFWKEQTTRYPALMDGLKFRVYARECGKVKRVYTMESSYVPMRYFLPAAEGMKNPHWLLEE